MGDTLFDLLQLFRIVTLCRKAAIRKLDGYSASEEVTEVQDHDLRYILRRNPVRIREIAIAPEDKYESLLDKVQRADHCLKEHKKASVEVRPVYVPMEKPARGHVFITMLAYKIVREIERCTP